ncbi:MAG: TMEM175 family protein [Frankia sp.]
MAGSGRLEAFSDGVFAIAITLLVLDLAVPTRDEARDGGLTTALGREWPSYFAYLVSFLTIGIIWVNHHTVFDKVRFVDRPVLFANLGLLLLVSVIPFPTRLLAEYLTAGSNAHVAAAIYSATMLMMGLAFGLLWMTITRDERLLHERVDRDQARAAVRRFGLGNAFYLAAVGLAFVSAVGALCVNAAMAIYYCFDQLGSAKPGDRLPDHPGSSPDI